MEKQSYTAGKGGSDETFAQRLVRYKKMTAQNKRRKELGVKVHCWEDNPNSFFASSNSWYLRGLSSQLGNDDKLLRSFVGGDHLRRSDRMKLLRRSKAFLSRRSFADLSEESRPALYGIKGKIETVLDCFSSLKYSYSAPLPPRVVMRNRGMSSDFCNVPDHVRFFDICCSPDGKAKKARISDISRSSNIRLDPMDSPRQLFVYRCRIRRCIAWGYSVGLVPIMMTLTVFHRWHPLKKLLRVMVQAWNRFFTAGRPATERSKRMGVQGYIRRVEETINKGGSGYNSGWHPHYHVILFVPRDKLSVVSDMEDELREAWFCAVNYYFEKEFDECIDPSYAESFKKHGLVFSRYGNDDDKYTLSLFDNLTFNQQTLTYSKDVLERTSGRDKINFYQKVAGKTSESDRAGHKQNCHEMVKIIKKRPIRPVDDSEYMSKIFGCDPCIFYSGDSEMTSIYSKSSRIPFDLLLDDTAENNDLWVEYALATKGTCSFIFSRGLENRVRQYFDVHPERDTVKSFVKSDKVVAQIDTRVYNLLYQNFKVDEMLRVASRGYDVLCEWFRFFYFGIGLSENDITADMMPLPPHTCSPFGDKVDVLSFCQRSNLSSSSSSIDESTTVGTSDSSSLTRPIQLELQFYSTAAAVSTTTEEEPTAAAVSTTTEEEPTAAAVPTTTEEEPVTSDGIPYRQVISEILEDSINQLLIHGTHISRETFEIVVTALLEDKVIEEQRIQKAAEFQKIIDELTEQFSDDARKKSIQSRIDNVSKSKWYPSWYRGYLDLLKEDTTRVLADEAFLSKAMDGELRVEPVGKST